MDAAASFGGYHPPFPDRHYVYLLDCADQTVYVGCTSDLDDRMKRHLHGWVGSTKHRLPVQLKMYMVFPDRQSAFKFEKYLKSGSGRAFLNRHLK